MLIKDLFVLPQSLVNSGKDHEAEREVLPQLEMYMWDHVCYENVKRNDLLS